MKKQRVYKCTKCPRTRTIILDSDRTNQQEFPPDAGPCFCDSGAQYLPVEKEKQNV